MSKFVSKGIYYKKGEEHKFQKTLTAKNQKEAQEKVYAEFGSKNKLKRRAIIINEIKEEKKNE